MRPVLVHISPTKHTSNLIKFAAQIQTGETFHKMGIEPTRQPDPYDSASMAGMSRLSGESAGVSRRLRAAVGHRGPQRAYSLEHCSQIQLNMWFILFCYPETWNSSFASFLFWLRWSGNIWFNLCKMMLASIPPTSQRSDVTWGADRAHTEAEKPCSH